MNKPRISHNSPIPANTTGSSILQITLKQGEQNEMKATGIVRRIDDLGRVVIPKEIRRTMRLRDGDPSLKTLTQDLVFCSGMQELAGRRYIG